MVQAKPALVEASALNPRWASARALPTSNGFGRMKQPLSCIFLNVARLSADVTGMVFLPVFAVCAVKIVTVGALDHHLAQKCPLFGQDEPVLLGEIEVRHALAVRAQPCAISL